jgi:signal transduction histidine kinase
MGEFLRRLFDSDFMPHGHCYYWRPEIVWLHVLSDSLIALAYYSIPIFLIAFIRKRRDVPFPALFVMFGVFILACGTTHVMEIWTLWHGTYRLAGLVKVVTAVASIGTAIALVPILPKALSLRSPTDWERANQALNQEITERERVENTLRAATVEMGRVNRELEAFSYSVSHDLRAPLRAMQGFSQALLEDYAHQLDATGHDYARRIVDAADRMDHLIQDILAYSRLTTEEIRPQIVELLPLVEQVLQQMAVDVEARQAQIVVEPPLPAVVGERLILSQVLVNLLSNALKFVDKGVVPRVRVWAEGGDGKVRLWVEDNGVGIAPEHKERIFRVFERLHGRESYAGTGIGLAIVRRGLERLGGAAGVESEPGKGSRFWIELPRERP